MKQGINPMNNLHILQDASRSRSNSRTTFTGDDAERKKCRIEVLISTKRDNKFKLSDKKALAVRVYDNSVEYVDYSLDVYSYSLRVEDDTFKCNR